MATSNVSYGIFDATPAVSTNAQSVSYLDGVEFVAEAYTGTAYRGRRTFPFIYEVFQNRFLRFDQTLVKTNNVRTMSGPPNPGQSRPAQNHDAREGGTFEACSRNPCAEPDRGRGEENGSGQAVPIGIRGNSRVETQVESRGKETEMGSAKERAGVRDASFDIGSAANAKKQPTERVLPKSSSKSEFSEVEEPPAKRPKKEKKPKISKSVAAAVPKSSKTKKSSSSTGAKDRAAKRRKPVMPAMVSDEDPTEDDSSGMSEVEHEHVLQLW